MFLKPAGLFPETVNGVRPLFMTDSQSAEACLTTEIAAAKIIYIQTISISRNAERFAS